MKNKIALLLAAVLLVPTLAAAGDRYNRGYNNGGYNRGYNQGYKHNYNHNYNHNRNNWVAPAIGAVILGGVIGAALSQPQAPAYVQPPPGYRYEYRYETVYVPSCNCYQTVLVPN